MPLFISYEALPRVSTAELLAQIGYQQAKGLENEIMVFAELLHQWQRWFVGRNRSNCHSVFNSG